MADGFIGLEIETDPDAITQDAFDYMASRIPGWTPAEGNPDVVMIEGFSQEESIERALVVQVSLSIFRYIGSIFGINPLDPTPATTTSTWTMVDNAGYTIPARTQVGLPGPDGQLVGFRTLSDVVVLAGSTATAAGEVVLEAVVEGEAGSGLSGAVELIDALAFVDSIALVSPTSGGTDGEAATAFLDRFSRRLRLQATTLVLPRDFELVATDVEGIARAVAIPNYNADTDTHDEEKTITVAVADADGEIPPLDRRNELKALYQDHREEDFLSFVIGATYTKLDVDFAGVALPGFDIATVEANAIAAITGYASPPDWGLPTSGDPGASGGWINRTVVRFFELITVANNVEGMDYVETLTLGRQRPATIVAATDIVTSTGHGYSNGDEVIFRSLTGGAGLTVGTTYFVRDVTTNTFKVAATLGGAAINVTTDASAGVVTRMAAVDVDLPGVVAMPRPDVITGDVSAP